MSGAYGNGFDGGMMPGQMMSTQSPQNAYRSAQDHSMSLNRELAMYEQQFNKVLDTIQVLVNEADALHRHYDEAHSEKLYLESTAEQAEALLTNTRTIFERFTVVEDPVVASDGFTYERETITDYINGTAKEGATPLSYQTKEPLTSLLIPNRSLKTLMSRLEEQLSAAPAQLQQHTNSSSNAKQPAGPKGGNMGAVDGGAVGHGGGHGHGGHSQKEHHGGGSVELNASGDRVHPCIRVYGYCNYKDSCSYARYPYDACLSNLKGKCRFKNQCHERHVEYRGPLNDHGEPVGEAGQQRQQAKDGSGSPAKSEEKK